MLGLTTPEICAWYSGEQLCYLSSIALCICFLKILFKSKLHIHIIWGATLFYKAYYEKWFSLPQNNYFICFHLMSLVMAQVKQGSHENVWQLQRRLCSWLLCNIKITSVRYDLFFKFKHRILTYYWKGIYLILLET